MANTVNTSSENNTTITAKLRNGLRNIEVKNQLLVIGYCRQVFTDKYKIHIPNEIINYCIIFRFLVTNTMLTFIGYNNYYEMGDNHNQTVTKLTQPTWTNDLKIANVFNGYRFSIYETMDGSFYSSGNNADGQCIQQQGKDKYKGKTATKIPLISRKNIKNIFCNAAAGKTGFILYRNNTLKAFGNNYYGNIGNGSNKSTFKLNEIKLNHKIIIIKGASFYSILLTLSGELYSTGQSPYGGHGQNGSSNQWKQINGIKNIKTFDIGYQHTICVDNNNNVFGFGLNVSGQMGLGNSNYKSHSKPRMVPFFNQSKIGIMDVKCGGAHSLALSINHKIYSWGKNVHGECGLGIKSKDPITTPQQISSFKNQTMIEIICGAYHNASINEKGDIFLFGSNEYNECILPNYNSNSDSPKQINDYIKQKYNKVIHKIILGYHNTKLILINNEEKEEIKMNEPNINKNQSKSKSSKQRNEININKEWKCNICTFLNDWNINNCLMCGAEFNNKKSEINETDGYL